ncbi:MAG: ABC transporter permease [Acidobacteriaceae bacterium]|nr:ABC transporter permease [Acidobacteriaceae bacterium]
MTSMDLKFAFRSLRKNPGFSVLALVVIALGIGANTAVFSVVNAVLLKPLAYRDPDRIVTLWSLWTKAGSHGQVSAPDFRDWHDQSTSFVAMAYYADEDMAATVGSATEYAHIAEVSPEFCRVFEIQPAIGRFFTVDEEKPGSAGAAVISYSYGQRHFGSEPSALGKTVRVFGKTLPIIGVMPPGFHFPEKTDIWFPANTIIPDTTSRSAHNFRVVARLKTGVSLERAQAQMSAIGARLERQYRDSNQGKSVLVTRMRDEMVRNVRLTLELLLAAVGMVLLIACANLANLLLARATGRTREIAIRAAVGASRGRIVRQLIAESMLLAVAGGIGGLALAVLVSRALVAMAPGNVPRLTETGIDGTVLVFTLGLSVVACFLFGLAPAYHTSRVDLNESLKQGAGRTVIGGSTGRLRSGFVIAEIALSVVLVVGAGLLMKSFVALHNVALGFQPERVLVMETSVSASDLESARRAIRFYKGLLEDLSGMPGVRAAGATGWLPGEPRSNGSYWIDHLPHELSIAAPNALFSVVAPGTFRTLGIPLKHGRDFNDSDTYDAPFTAVINEALARQSFHGHDPIGHVVFCGLDSDRPMKIVGIVGDTRQYGPAHQPEPEIYMPYEQHPEPSTALNVVVRTAGDPIQLSQMLQREAGRHSAEVPVKFTTLEASLSENMAPPRFRTLLLGIFAGLALCLAMAGVYGVMAYVVGHRWNEIGVRMALGATTRDVLRLVLGQALGLAGIGLVLGLLGAFAVSRLLTTMLFEVKPGDPLTYAGVAVMLLLVSLAASYFPAWRATKVDPVVALREE